MMKMMQEFANQKLEATELGIRAKLIDIDSLPNHEKPTQVRDEIPTLNKTGYMKFELEHYSKSFIRLAKEAKNPVLEIGPAYGWLTHKVLEEGATIVAADISNLHLEILVKEAPKQYLDNLYIYNGKFPSSMNFPKKTFDVIYMSRVLHFLDGKDIEKGLDKIYEWLTPRGKFIAINCSIYHSCVKEKMGKVFEERIRLGDKWPGRVNKDEGIAEVHDDYSPEFLNVFHEEQLKTLLPEHGYYVEEISLFDYPSEEWNDGGKGHIGFIATKV